ncbi:hypothetical protein NF27_DK00020, partial [Candidatus Jidaibacter acanthamoeba]
MEDKERYVRQAAAESLGKIGQGSEKVIDAL